MPSSCSSLISLALTVCLPDLLPLPLPHVLFSNRQSRPAHLHAPSGLADLLHLVIPTQLLSWQFGVGPVQMKMAEKPARQLMSEHLLCSYDIQFCSRHWGHITKKTQTPPSRSYILEGQRQKINE